MKSVKSAIIDGFFVWIATLAIAMLLYPLRSSDRIFFEGIIPVILVIFTVIFSLMYFKKVTKDFKKEGMYLGLVFITINFVLDMLVFMWGPMQMGFVAYLKDIGITYILMFAVTTGFGYVIDNYSQTR